MVGDGIRNYTKKVGGKLTLSLIVKKTDTFSQPMPETV